jgi:o-succinylbenzoate---CoA ligase
MKIDWQDNSSHVFLNPRLNLSVDQKLISKRRQGHLWLATSGSAKIVGLSKKAILASAEAVNKFIGSDANDIWLQILPVFHIGGLSVYARASLSNAKVVTHTFTLGKWDARKFEQLLTESKATLTSIVPTQVYDLVRNKIKAPPSLRYVFVGGSDLEPWLYEEAKKLNWPLAPTYGMTESSSQVATATLDSMDLKLLPHVKVRVTELDKIALMGPSLFTEYCIFADGDIAFHDPKIGYEFLTEDYAEVVNGVLKPLGRGRDFVKVAGEGVYLNRLRGVLHGLQFQEGVSGELDLQAHADARLGKRIDLMTTTDVKDVETLVEKFNKAVMPYERIHSVFRVESFNKGELGK